MSAAFGYVDGYVCGQHDALTWLTIPGDDDYPLAAFDSAVKMRAALVCLAHNLAIGGGLCQAANTGPLRRHPDAHEPHEFSEASNGCDCTVCGEGFCYYLHTDRPEYEP